MEKWLIHYVGKWRFPALAEKALLWYGDTVDRKQIHIKAWHYAMLLAGIIGVCLW